MSSKMRASKLQMQYQSRDRAMDRALALASGFRIRDGPSDGSSKSANEGRSKFKKRKKTR